MFNSISKFFKKVFKTKTINNDRGSVLSVSLIVITILTFSLTTLTSSNVNLAGSTTYQMEQVNDDSIAKGLIRQVISEFEYYILNTGSYLDYNNVEISNVLSKYGVVVSDETDSTEGYGDFGDIESRAYKFSYPMTDGDILTKFVYVSNFGTIIDPVDPFEFSLATNGNLILNSGFYDDISMYGEEIRIAETAPYVFSDWYWDWGLWQWVEYYDYTLTPTNSSVFPDINSSNIYKEYSYEYCTNNCHTTFANGDEFMINESNYIDVDGGSLADPGNINSDIISDFFTDWDYEEFVVDFMQNDAPKDRRVITDTMTLDTLGTVALANSDVITYRGRRGRPSYPSTAFSDITLDNHYDFTDDEELRFSALYVGDLEFNGDMDVRQNDEAMVIIGNLTINNTQNNVSKIEGNYIITGDLIFIGDSVDLEGTFMVLGQTIIDFYENEGIVSNGRNDGVTFLNGDNILVNSIWESHDSSRNDQVVSVFMYTEESIYIDAVNSRFHVLGSLFAKASGLTLNPIFLQDEANLPVHGIVINSYQGYINYWGNAVPSNNEDRNGFVIEQLSRSNYQRKFDNLPAFASIVSQVGIPEFQTSEWILE